ncbi:MAG: IS110 family transposase, partial [Clostridiales bacterium]|nr:IS110 family transposase [Clostridiales bacterium]
ALANIRTKRNKQACNPVILEFCKQKCQSKPRKVALGAVMRKIIIYIFAVLRDRIPYQLRSPHEYARMLAAKHTAA